MRQLWDGNGDSLDLGIDKDKELHSDERRDDRGEDEHVSRGIEMKEDYVASSHERKKEIGRERQDKDEDGDEDEGEGEGTEDRQVHVKDGGASGTESGSLLVSNHVRSMVEDAYREEGAIEVCGYHIDLLTYRHACARTYIQRGNAE